MIKSVPNENFPFITCYARIINRITSLPLTDFTDALKNENPWQLGIVKDTGGCCQYLVEFDVWNNEEKVSGGFTQRIFNDAKNCKVSVYANRNKTPLNDNVSIKIKDSINNTPMSTLYDKYDIYGNVFNKCGILSGKGEHTQFQIAIDIIKEFKNNGKLEFVVCFEYDDQDIHVELFFDCNINITNRIYPVKRINIGNNAGVFTGNINNVQINNGLIQAYNLNNVLQDQQVLNSNKYRLFLKDGIYNFIIKTNSFERNFNHVTVNGIHEYYSQITDGLIAEIFSDIVRYYDIRNNEEVIVTEVYGKLVNEYDEPLVGADIIVSSKDELIMYYITDKYGQYKFELTNGIYDVRLVSNERALKMINNFSFDDDFGFFPEIQNNVYSFNKNFQFTSNY